MLIQVSPQRRTITRILRAIPSLNLNMLTFNSSPRAFMCRAGSKEYKASHTKSLQRLLLTASAHSQANEHSWNHLTLSPSHTLNKHALSLLPSSSGHALLNPPFLVLLLLLLLYIASLSPIASVTHLHVHVPAFFFLGHLVTCTLV